MTRTIIIKTPELGVVRKSMERKVKTKLKFQAMHTKKQWKPDKVKMSRTNVIDFDFLTSECLTRVICVEDRAHKQLIA